ncbi:MAG: ABC transporter permease, partial [Promethearchaeota archaeon]
MALPASVVIARRVLLQIVRDRRTFAMILAVPFVVTFIFATAISGEIKNAPVVIVDKDSGTTIWNSQLNQTITVDVSDLLISYLQNDSRLKVTKIKDWNQAKEDVDKGKYRAAIQFPQNLSVTVLS